MESRHRFRHASELVPRISRACPYCGEARQYKGSSIPRDDCCLPRALAQLGWMTAYLAGTRGDPQERRELGRTAARLERMLREAEVREPGAIRYALAAIEETEGRSGRYAAAAAVAARLAAR